MTVIVSLDRVIKMTPFNEGDFILIEYTARVKETGNIIDTTNEDIAKKEGIYESNRVYGPTLVVLGKGWVIKGLEEELAKMNEGEEREIVIPPTKAYGERDPSKIKVFSIREFRRRNIEVRVGDVIDFGGTTGVVKSITGGRVVVDFNHPLAGKTLVYKVKIVKKLEALEEKLRALVAKHFNIKIDDVVLEYNPGERKVVVNVPTRIMTRKDIQYAKIALVSNIFEYFKDDIEKIVLQEVFERKRPSEETKASGAEKEVSKETSAGKEQE